MVSETSPQPSDDRQNTELAFARGIALELLQEACWQSREQRFEAALESCQIALAIYQKIDDRVGEAYCLTNIGNVYRSQALYFYNQAKAILEERNNREGQQAIEESLSSPLNIQRDWYVSIGENVMQVEPETPLEAPNGDHHEDDSPGRPRVFRRRKLNGDPHPDGNPASVSNGDHDPDPAPEQ